MAGPKAGQSLLLNVCGKKEDSDIFLIDHEGQPYTPVRPIIENLGIDWKVQHRKIATNSKRWATVAINTTVAGDGKNREMLCMPVRKVPAFLGSIDPRKVKPEIRPKLELYQEECDEALWNYWTQGQAVNPRTPEIDGVFYSADEQKDIVRTLMNYAQMLESKIPPPKPKRKQSKKLTNEEACLAYDLERQGFKQKDIAAKLGRSTASISYFFQYRPSLPLL